MVRPSDPIVIPDDDSTASEASAGNEVNKSRLTKRKLSTKPTNYDDWSDESDGNHATFKKRKATSKKPSTVKGKEKAVPRGRSSRKPADRKAKPNLNGSTASEDESALSTSLPTYFQKRRKAFDENCQAFHEAGLRLPPDYSDVYFSDDERLADLEEKPQFGSTSGINPCHPYKDIKIAGGLIPASLAQYLRDYQIQGVQFLYDLFIHQRGGILGDDMGLGKTVQVAAFLTVAFGKTGDSRDAKRRRTKDDWYPRVLIVCPGSLIKNWTNELERWGWWVVDVFHGSKRDDVLGTAQAGRLEVMVTTYTTYKNSANEVNIVPWDIVIADECHCIKDPAAGITQSMNLVNSLCRIGLTGTAIQNNYEELWALLNWTNPDCFGTLGEWQRMVAQPLALGQSHDATLHQLSTARTTAKKLRDNLLPKFFLRRLKSLIADQLPKKSDKREAYENILSSPIAQFVLESFDQCPCGSGNTKGHCCFEMNADGEKWQALTFPLIISLQKLANHFNLLMPRTTDLADKYQREIRILQAAAPRDWETHYASRDSILNLANPEYCGKWKVLKKLLEFWHKNGDKVLVFSHSVRLLNILQQLFNKTLYNVSYLDGSLSYEDRQGVVDNFNCDPNQFIFLISTKAGGVGLNITSANKVVIMDPHWNPSYDLQAQDRAYRIGQVRDVDVYRLISVGTIEEITYARQIYKQQQANIGYNASNERRYFKGVQHQSKGELFGIQNLLTYNGDEGVLRNIVNKTNVAEARAGVKMIDINIDEVAQAAEKDLSIKKEGGADDETGGLKQLSTMLTAPRNKRGVIQEPNVANKAKSDPIQAILAGEGVEYTHENSEVIGSSKIENEISRWAEKAMDPEGGLSGLALFLETQQAHSANEDHKFFHSEFNPPGDVMQRQFCSMAKEFGFASVTEFALAVESMTQEQRRNCLDSFYKIRAEQLGKSEDINHRGDMKMEVKDKNLVKTEVDDSNLVKLEVDAADPNHTDSSLEFKADVDKEDLPAQSVNRGIHNIKPEPTESPLRMPLPVVPSPDGVKPDRRSISIWLSDDEETDEL
ncbi:P-loop containing nucleoside triphosphate hydrolase protein [Xylaria bambusicola]|uniref:P-loop containing nucleoside triphosphate hydrolase protein n=1 Tax=Xylaria bambusicola TaxID=326684 RepID=UPI002008D20E|nr:P-loop containing nucleoside triphosphate hydrolase protein [Xylaria bambusicola]KAI0514519.1 P-loop containing nucleoside triphosphate hydrolase protein [Xylaria bambusicola]